MANVPIVEVTRKQIRTAILAHVQDVQGCKATELAAFVSLSLTGGISNPQQFTDELDALIVEGSIVEIEYTLPEMEYRVKSFLLPKGAVVKGR